MAKQSRTSLLAAVDIGSSKICCLIGTLDERRQLRVIGIGHQLSRGIRSGAVVDMDAATAAVAQAVHTAEKMAGETIQSVVVGVAGADLRSQRVVVDVDIDGQEVTDADVRRMQEHTRSSQLPDDRTLLHLLPVTYGIDDTTGIRDPRGMYGRKLSGEFNIITASTSVIRNLQILLGRCHLDVEQFIAAPYASGKACLNDDEWQLGATLIDIGGGTTSVGVFQDRALVYVDTLPVGGHHVTNDIARGLLTPLQHAERMKTLYGNILTEVLDERELIDVPQMGDDDGHNSRTIQRSMLRNIIKPRVEENIELVRSHLDDSDYLRRSGRRCVLTGGASELTGLSGLATVILDKQVRIGRPKRMNGLAEATEGPAFSCVIGMLMLLLEDSDNRERKVRSASAKTNRLWQNVKSWFDV